MAKSRKQQRKDARDKAQEKKFFTVVAISTVIFLAILFFVFQGMS